MKPLDCLPRLQLVERLYLALDALRAAMPIITSSIESWIDCDTIPGDDGTPDTATLTEDTRDHVERELAVARMIFGVVGPGHHHAAAPGWLVDLIERRREL